MGTEASALTSGAARAIVAAVELRGATVAVTLRRADLAEPARLAEGFAGAAALVSNAALLSLRNQRWVDYERANVQGAANVFDAAAAAGVRRVVQVSSVGVYRRHRPCVTEDAPLLDAQSRRTWFNAYPLSKALAEQIAWQKAAEHGIALQRRSL